MRKPSLSKQSHAQAVVVLASVLSARIAAAYPGEQLLNWAKNNIIGPLGLLALVLAIVAAIFEPKFIKTAVYTAMICAFLFFIINGGPQVMEAMR